MNEWIKQLPAMLSGDEIKNKLEVLPEYDSGICKADIQDRLLALSNIHKIFIPSDMSVEIYTKLYLAILRSLKIKTSTDAVKLRNQNYKIIKQQESRGSVCGASSFTIIGQSGIGKTSAIERAIEVATEGKILELTEVNQQIIPCIQIQCPFDCSVKSMLLDILHQIDIILGTQYFERAIINRATVDILIGSVATTLLNHVALLVIDEIQNIVNHRSGDKLVGALTQLINNSGVPIVMVGIPESEVFFQKTDYLARRAIGLRYDALPYDEVFIDFCCTIYSYQYTKSAEAFDEKIALWLYEHSGGSIAIVVALIHDAQEIAILEGNDYLSLAALDTAYKKRYEMVRKQQQKSITTSVCTKKKMDKKCVQQTVPSGSGFLYSEILQKTEGMDVFTMLKAHIPVLEVAL